MNFFSQPKRVLSLLVLFVGLASCEKSGNMWFRTKKGMDKRLQGTWERLDLGNVGPTQHWEFKDGKAYITETTGPQAGTVIDSSGYILQAGLSRGHIIFDDFGASWLREKFQILRIDKKYFVIYYNSGINGQYTAEFEKIE